MQDHLWKLLLLGCFWAIGMHAPAQALTIESDQQLKYADTLFTDKQYLRAAEEYQRFIFFFPDHPEHRKIRFKVGESFYLAKEPAMAIDIFKALSSIEPLDHFAIEAHFRLADCYLALNSPSIAVQQLNKVITLSDETGIKDRAYYRIGWIYIDTTDLLGSKSAFNQMSSAGQQQYGWNELDQALSGASAIPSKNPSIAGVLSVIPGGGQLYCRRYEDAVIAFTVNIGLIWAAHDAFDNEQYGLGGLLSFVGLGFYAGNIYGAINDAHKFNMSQKEHFIDQLKRQQYHFPGTLGDTAIGKGPLLRLKISF